jgi:hypothetical protein
MRLGCPTTTLDRSFFSGAIPLVAESGLNSGMDDRPWTGNGTGTREDQAKVTGEQAAHNAFDH